MSFDFSRVSETWPENWSFKKLSEVADVNLKTISKKEQPEYIYYIDISSVSTGYCEYPKKLKFSEAPSRARRIIKNNDIIISTVRPNLKQHVLLENVDKNWIASTGFCVVSPKDANTAWYIYSILTSDVFNEHLVRVADGGAYPAFNPKEIEDALIPWPDENNLLQINKFIKSIFNKIELNNQVNQTLEAIAQAIFKSWFVDFEPVKAKMAVLQAGGSLAEAELAAMMAISGKTAKQLSTMRTTQPEAYQQLTQTAALFPAAMEDSELGEIPEGWRNGVIGEISNVKAGYAFKGEWFISEGNPVVKIKNITGNGDVDIDDCQYINDNIAQKVSKFKLNDGDLLMAMTGATVAKTGLLVTEGRNVYLNQRVAKFESEKFGSKIAWFLYCCFERDNIFDLIVGAAQGSAQPNISSSGIEATSITLPNDDLIHTFCDKTNSLFQQWMSNKCQNSKLKEIRDSLLPKLLSGEIDLSEMHEVA